MSLVLLLRCDETYPDRTPNECRAYRPLPGVGLTTGQEVTVATFTVLDEGWLLHDDGTATCPSCARIKDRGTHV